MELALPGDLIRVIGAYSTFVVTVRTLTLTATSAAEFYRRGSAFWRDKCLVETMGVMLDDSVVGDWLLYYRMVDKHHYGRVVSPVGRSRVPTNTNIVAMASNLENLVYVARDSTGDYIYRATGEGFRLPGSVRLIKDQADKLGILLENGSLYYLGSGDTVTLVSTGPFVDFTLYNHRVEVITRDRNFPEISYEGEVLGESDEIIVAFTNSRDGYIDPNGRVVGVLGYELDDALESVDIFTTFYYQGGDSYAPLSGRHYNGLLVTGDYFSGNTPNASEGPKFISLTETFSSDDIGNTYYIYALISADQRLYFIFDHTKVIAPLQDFLSIRAYDRYAGLIETISGGYVLVSD